MQTSEQPSEPEQLRTASWALRGIGYAAFAGVGLQLANDVYHISMGSSPFTKEGLIKAGITATELLIGNRFLAYSKQFEHDAVDLEMQMLTDSELDNRVEV